jgi:ABC-2 type transport system ATP-binding protein
MSSINIENLSTGYGKVQVLHDITFAVPENSCFGLIGLNGAGKTTLIKVLLGLRKATAGQAHILGHEIGSREVKEKISYLPEKFEPPAFLTGFEFIRFTQELYGRFSTDEEILEMATELQLQHEALPRRVTSYSKGMRQKLGLMASLLSGCPLVILDEPMSGLDPQARILVKDAILNYQRKGNTVVMCSHILADLEEMCPAIAVIHQGHLVFNGSPQELIGSTGQSNLERAFLARIGSQQQAAA